MRTSTTRIPLPRVCVIFNPAARGEKAARFQKHLKEFSKDCVLKATASAGGATVLAAEAIAEGFNTIVAAGGDGTINEVLNGMCEAPDGLKKARLGVLPLGTVNVFARELNIPRKLDKAWAIIQKGRELKIDLPYAEFQVDGQPERRYFVQLAGAGLDARAIELVDWKLKKKTGPIAYVVAGLKALREKQPSMVVSHDGKTETGQLMLIGNGKYYGGSFDIFPGAKLNDGLMDVTVFPKVDWPTLFHCGATLLTRGSLPKNRAMHFSAASIKITGTPGAAFEVDGEYCGKLPATFSMGAGGVTGNGAVN